MQDRKWKNGKFIDTASSWHILLSAMQKVEMEKMMQKVEMEKMKKKYRINDKKEQKLMSMNLNFNILTEHSFRISSWLTWLGVTMPKMA